MEKQTSTSILICVSTSDINYLFSKTITSVLKYVNFAQYIYIVTPDPCIIKKEISKIDISNVTIRIIPDSEVLTEKELMLPGWCKQQIIKLRSYTFCKTDYIFSVGADVVIVDNINFSDFYSEHSIILHYRNHETVDKHLLFEIERVRNIYNLLGIKSDLSYEKDYIFDLFLFDCKILKKMEDYFIDNFGGYSNIFPKQVYSYDDMVNIGEWSLYCVFIIELSKYTFRLVEGGNIIEQVHSRKDIINNSLKSKAVHFVDNSFDLVDVNNFLNYE
jgi:hypothetical protein